MSNFPGFLQIHRLQIIIMAILLICASSLASKTFQPVYKPFLEISKSAASIKIDGKLDDAEWKSFARAENFVERHPGDMVQPAVETEVLITYDDDNLYVAYLCYDDPEAIRATMCERDRFYGDDAVCLLIDTYGNASWAYEFFVNPYGIQKDNLWSSVGGEDPGFDLIWKSAAQITDSGYQVEMAIPFASLRFPNKDVQNWRVDFWRNRPRESFNQYSWAAYDRNEQCWPCQWGTIEGIKNVRPGKGLEILPTQVLNQVGNLPETGASIDEGPVKGEFSLGGKYAVSSDVTFEATFNPDFSQIESDAQQVDVNTTYALLYPERRPFFQEGSDIFRTLFNSFYTRTINDPDFAAKFTGRTERTTFGFMSARDENSPYVIPLDDYDVTFNSGKSTVNVLRGLQAIGDDSHVGIMITDRRFDGGGSGTIFAVDGDIRLSRNYSIVGQIIGSHVKEPHDHSRTRFFEGTINPGWEDSVEVILEPIAIDNGKYSARFDGETILGHALITQFRRNARYWDFTFDYHEISPSYRTETGYDPINNHRTTSFYTSYTFYPAKGLLERITPQFYVLRRWDFSNGSRKIENHSVSVGGQWKFAQTYTGISYRNNAAAYGGAWFEDLWRVGFDLHNRVNSQISCGFYVGYGNGIAYWFRMKGRETSLSVYTDLKPIDRLVIEPSFNYFKSDHIETGRELLSQKVFRARVRLQANRELSLRMIFQYNDLSRKWEFDPLLTYRISSFSLFYVGSTSDFYDVSRDPDKYSHWKMTSRQFFMKLQYLFRV